MKLSRNMEWSLPFLEAAADLVPLHTVSVVRGYSVPVGKEPTTEGAITHYTDGSITITVMLTGYTVSKDTGERMGASFEVALLTLAHELAHLVHWEHTPEHLLLTARLLQRFARVARQEGVQDTSRRLKRRAA